MSSHEHFRELSALAAIGQLSLGEDRELYGHLRECTECRDAYDDYASVVQHKLPQADPARWRIRSAIRRTAPDGELRDRFLARARAEGIDFSREAEGPRPRHVTPFHWAMAWRSGLAAATVAVLAVSGTWLTRKYQLVPRSSVVNAGVTASTRENESLSSQLVALRQSVELDSAELGRARKEESISQEVLQQLQKQLEEARMQSEILTAQLQQAESKETELAGENHEQETVIANLSSKNEKLHREGVDNLSTRVLLEAQVRDLTDSLQQQMAYLERERQLMAVGRDVRQLMGARSLHIIDVHDVDGGGKSARSFGRVIYAEGQSLIFYAFDLPSGKLTPAKYTFEAWGQKEYVSQTVRNLGTFTVDDHEQGRWVLKVTDPALLKGIDSVFVTAEALGDAKEPRGKKLLYAYIVGQANHP